jgi:hypothetical protein
LRFRQWLLVALMAITLVGVQVVQASPLHDHTQHSVDCALCHLQLNSDGVAELTLTFDYLAPAVRYAQLLREFYSFSNPSPYQGRAPPCSSR